MNKYQTEENDQNIPAEIPKLIRHAERQIRINEAEIRDLETMIKKLISETEHRMLILDNKDDTEGILGYLLQYRCRHDLVSRCACLILENRYQMRDLLRIFGSVIFTEAAVLLDQAYKSYQNNDETNGFSCPGPDDNVLVQDPEVIGLFCEYERIMRFLDRKAEKHELLRHLVRDRYRNELVCLCTRYMLVESLPVNDLKGMFGPDICAEAFILLQDMREKWTSET